MFVQDWMTTTLVTGRADETVEAAQQRMVRRAIGRLPVLGDEDRLDGIITLEDVRGLLLSGGDESAATALLRARTVGDVMSREVVTVSPGDTVEHAAALLQRHKISGFPVVDGSPELVGMLTTTDLLRAFIDVLGLSRRGVRMVFDFVGSKTLHEVVSKLEEADLDINALFTYRDAQGGGRQLVVRARGDDTQALRRPDFGDGPRMVR